MFRIAATSSKPSDLEVKPLDQTTIHQSFWQKTATFAKESFHTISKNFEKGFVISAGIITPLNCLINWTFDLKNDSTLIDTMQKIDQILEVSFLSTPYGAYGIGIVLLPIVEEIICRAGIQNGIKKASKYLLSKNVSLKKDGKDEIYASKISRILGSVIFGAIHLDPLEALCISISSYFMESSAYEKDGLAGSIGMHMGNNAMCGVWDCVTILRRRYFSIG